MTVPFNKKFYPVVQYIGAGGKFGIQHAITNTETALSNGADGVLLVERDGQKMHYADLHFIYTEVRKQFPFAWIGLNFRDLSSREKWDGLVSITKRCNALNALWIDEMPVFRVLENSPVQIFGGITSRYVDLSRGHEDFIEICEDAIQFLDVAVTYSEKTGVPPNINRLEFAHQTLNGRIPLALAGGVTIENVQSFLPVIDHFIVGSSLLEIRSGIEYFVATKVRELANAIH